MRVVWSKRAQQEYIKTFDYIAGEFGYLVALNFDELYVRFERNVLEMPNMGSLEPLLSHREKPYRSFVLHRLCKVIYYVEDEVIYIAAIWDTRRLPNNLVKGL